ncbi:MAG: DUF123 domain-containing protein [Pelovirga sp.]
MSIGRLGVKNFVRGWYGYCGSAFGPGGLRARLRHHFSPTCRCHWHIDYLKAHARLRTVCWCADINHEHNLSRYLLEAGAQVPVAGFGSSDCGCISHLVWVENARLVDLLNRQIAADMGFSRLASAVLMMSLERSGRT